MARARVFRRGKSQLAGSPRRAADTRVFASGTSVARLRAINSRHGADTRIFHVNIAARHGFLNLNNATRRKLFRTRRSPGRSPAARGSNNRFSGAQVIGDSLIASSNKIGRSSELTGEWSSKVIVRAVPFEKIAMQR